MKEAVKLHRSVYLLIMIDTLFLRPSLHFTPLHSTSLHFTPLHYTSLHFTTLVELHLFPFKIYPAPLQYTSLLFHLA